MLNLIVHGGGGDIRRRALHALRRVNGLGNRVVRRIGQLEVVGRKLLVVRLCVVIDEIARARHRVAGDGDFGGGGKRQQIFMERNGVAARQFKRVANNIRRGETAQLDAGTARILHRDRVPLDGGDSSLLVDVDAAIIPGNRVALDVDRQGGRLVALKVDRVAVRRSARTVQHAVRNRIGTFHVRAVVDLDALQRTLGDAKINTLKEFLRRIKSARRGTRNGQIFEVNARHRLFAPPLVRERDVRVDCQRVRVLARRADELEVDEMTTVSVVRSLAAHREKIRAIRLVVDDRARNRVGERRITVCINRREERVERIRRRAFLSQTQFFNRGFDRRIRLRKGSVLPVRKARDARHRDERRHIGLDHVNDVLRSVVLDLRHRDGLAGLIC